MSVIVKILHPNKEDMISFELAKLNVRIGRSDKAEITIPDSMCSGIHMRIFGVHGKTYIEDLGSKNGTKLNGEKISIETQVYLRDEVLIGSYILALDRVEMSAVEIRKHSRPYKVNNELDLPELTRSTINIQRIKEELTHVDVKTEMFKDLEDLSSKTIVKRYKVKSQQS